MATGTLITAEQYLAMHFDQWEPELVHGEVVERPMPNRLHAKIQHLLELRLTGAGDCYPGLRLRLNRDTIRVPDISVFAEPQHELMPSNPPLIIVEVISPDDRHQDLVLKLEQYRKWGVTYVWAVEPELEKFYAYGSHGFAEVDHFAAPEAGFQITAAELFAAAGGQPR